MKLVKELWHHDQQKEIWLYTVTGDNITLAISNLGCTIVSLKLTGRMKRNIVLGYQTAQQYLQDTYYVGSLVGRYAGRIGNAAFHIGDRKYSLTANDKNAVNHLHGGEQGFNKKIFDVVSESADDGQASVRFYRKSPHLEEGYPGNLDLNVTISLNRLNQVTIIYEAQTDRPTFINLTHHCYFNLAAPADAVEQRLQINADEILLTDQSYVPTGGIRGVAETRYDFRCPVNIKRSGQTKDFTGFNDYYIFKNTSVQSPQATLTDPQTGLSMAMQTTFPGLLFYTGDYLGDPFSKNQGICLEAQGYPDAPNHPNFPSTLLHPGQKYYHKTEFIVQNSDNL